MFFSPFGKLNEKSNFQKTLLKNFKTINKKKKVEGGFIEYQFKFAFRSSNLHIEFDNDLEASTHSYIVGGEIRDREIGFVNNVHIGMDVDDFCRIFFSFFPEEILERFKVIIFESCVTDIVHIYTFENKKLISVKFVKQ